MVDSIKSVTGQKIVQKTEKKVTDKKASDPIDFASNGTLVTDYNYPKGSGKSPRENMAYDAENEVLQKEPSFFKLFGKPLKDNYIFDYKKYVKASGDKDITIGEIKKRYGIPDGELRKLGLDGYPGDLDSYNLKDYPELQKLVLPKEIIEKYIDPSAF